MADDYEIVKEFYDNETHELPFIFGDHHFVTPPKNSSTWVRYVHSMNFPGVHEKSTEIGDNPNWVAVVRDPVERFVSACNSMKKRVSQDLELFRGYYSTVKKDTNAFEKGTGTYALTDWNLYRQRFFWNNVNINDIVDFEIDTKQLTSHISEFIPQYQWAMAYGPIETKKYNYVSPYNEIDDILLEVVGETVFDVLQESTKQEIRYWKNETMTHDDIEWFYHWDLTNRSIEKIKNIYRRDYEYGWCV